MKRVLLIGILLMFLIAFMLLTRSAKDSGVQISLKDNSFIEDVKILQKRNNDTTWILTASKASFTENDDKAKLEDVKISFEKDGVVLFAKNGVYDLKEKSFKTDSVINAESKDFKITADTIDYNINDRRLITGGKVKVFGKSFEIEGTGMITDKNQKVILEKDVTARFNK